MIASTGKRRSFRDGLWRVANSCWYGADPTDIEQVPDLLNGEFVLGINAAGTGTVSAVGVDSGNNVLMPNGVSLPIVGKVANYTLTVSDYTVAFDTTTGSLTATLPLAPGSGKLFNIKKIAAGNTLTISGNGNTIDGAASVSVTTLNQDTTIQFLSGAGWMIL